jgi:hypothetical protein
VDEVLAELTAMARDGTRPQRSGPKPPLAGAALRKAACGASHHWARLLQSFGHTVKLIAPQLVKLYVKRRKNDAADAEALCEAMSRPTMRFVPVKTAEQQAALMLVSVRDRLIRNRTQLALLHGSRGGSQNPQPHLRSSDADGVRVSQLQHPVQDMNGDADLGRPTLGDRSCGNTGRSWRTSCAPPRAGWARSPIATPSAVNTDHRHGPAGDHRPF